MFGTRTNIQQQLRRGLILRSLSIHQSEHGELALHHRQLLQLLLHLEIANVRDQTKLPAFPPPLCINASFVYTEDALFCKSEL